MFDKHADTDLNVKVGQNHSIKEVLYEQKLYIYKFSEDIH